ncbi:hypothetical protein H632_c1076p0 [Helicosporidium sp. ATCC 50920]|nr:hypothetical protein H632_c1076p0 [Helicosporidium sp. ATCC 50920]|eukprot:KDD74783.1 hypothetical protein H632_c1076p0 [Helicosporidium sp. ATCC 50920]
MPPPGRTCRDALQTKYKDVDVAALEKVMLCGVCPPICRMDASLGTLRACRHLALSTNTIDKIGSLSGLENLEVLSLGRNSLKRLDGLEAVGSTLKELWVSYNNIDRLAGIEHAPNLEVLYMSNNCVRDWSEIDRLAALPRLRDLVLEGNPLHAAARSAGTLAQYRAEISRRLPHLAKLDGRPVDLEEEREEEREEGREEGREKKPQAAQASPAVQSAAATATTLSVAG